VATGEDGLLAGIGTNRNILAYTLVLALAFAMSLRPRWRPFRVLWVAAVLVILGGVYGAQSGTGFIAVIAVAIALGFCSLVDRRRTARSRPSVTRAAWSLVIAVAGVLALRPDVLGVVLGRDSATLSGRIPFWEATYAEMNDHLLQGYGWRAVWPHPWQLAPPNNMYDRIWFTAATR
jgi:O-antigen ligase